MRVAREALVSEASGVKRAAEAVRAHGRFSLDTEFMREKTYRPLLCLVQIAVPEDIFLIDALETKSLDPIAELIVDPSLEVVVHAGRQDLEIFHDICGVVPKNVFDVQLAAAFAGLGSSLPYARLVDAVCSVTLAKGESYTHWEKRPLSVAQLHYAADDVRFLLDVADGLKQRLEEMGRLRWALEEMAELERESSYRVDLDNIWRRVSGKGMLSGRHAAVLKEVARWREETARERDLPRSWVVKDATLVEIARRAPKAIDALRSIRGLNPREIDRFGPALLAAVTRGLEAPPVKSEKAPSRSIQQAARTLAGIADGIIRARCDAAQISAELVSTRGELEALLVDILSEGEPEVSSHRLLQDWRGELAGEAVMSFIEGRTAVRATRRPPYVEEVTL